MVAAGGGSIVIVSSVAGVLAGPEMAGYVTAKHGLVGLMRSLAVDYGPKGVRVNALCPGWVRTPMSEREMDTLAETRGIDREQAFALVTRDLPLRRAADPDEIAAVALFLASDEASFVTGAVVLADGGSTALDVGYPRLLRLSPASGSEAGGPPTSGDATTGCVMPSSSNIAGRASARATSSGSRPLAVEMSWLSRITAPGCARHREPRSGSRHGSSRHGSPAAQNEVRIRIDDPPVVAQPEERLPWMNLEVQMRRRADRRHRSCRRSRRRLLPSTRAPLTAERRERREVRVVVLVTLRVSEPEPLPAEVVPADEEQGVPPSATARTGAPRGAKMSLP